MTESYTLHTPIMPGLGSNLQFGLAWEALYLNGSSPTDDHVLKRGNQSSAIQ